MSKTLDDVSSFNITGSASQSVAGENDLAQNPFDLAGGIRQVHVRRAQSIRDQLSVEAALLESPGELVSNTCLAAGS